MKLKLKNRNNRCFPGLRDPGLAGLMVLVFLNSSMIYAGSIEGTAHDLTSQGFSVGENCIICHTPHNSDISVTVTPLWNHRPSSSTFNMYFTADEAIETQPTGESKLCLSCHDGVTAIDKFNGRMTTPFLGENDADNISNKQVNSHPLSITFDSDMAAKNPSLYDPVLKQVTIGAGGEKTLTGTIDELLLSGGRIQCGSCHDVHNNFVGTGNKNQPFLKVTKAGSEICLTCHNK